MGDYVYYCKHCNTIEVDVEDNVNIRCPECNQKYYPLHVTEDEWNEMSDDEIRELLTRATAPRKVPVQINSNNEMDKQKVYPKQSVNAQKKSSGKEDGASGLSIAAFVLSFFGCTSLIGLILGIIDLTKKNGRKKGLSIAAVTISGIMLIVSIILLLSNPFKNDKDSSTKTVDTIAVGTETVSNDEEINFTQLDQEYTFCGITFMLPHGLSKDGDNTFGYSDNNKEIAIGFVSEDYDNMEAAVNSLPEIETLVDEYIDGVMEEFVQLDSQRRSASYSTIAGFKSRNAIFDVKSEGTDMVAHVDFIFNTKENSFDYFLFFASPEFESVYQKVISSARYTGTGSSVTDTPTVAKDEDVDSGASGVNPELKAFLDEYEAFMREYVDFMKKYLSDPGNVLSMLNDYTKMVERIEEFSEKADEYDASKDDMSKEDLAYYIDTIARIEKMYLEVLDMQ